MRWKTNIIAMSVAAAGAFAAFAIPAPASAQVNFQLHLGSPYGGPFRAQNQCHWQRIDRGRVDIVEQICRDHRGRYYVVPGSRHTLVNYNRREWRRWSQHDYRDWDRRRGRDWDRRDRRGHRDGWWRRR